jgi:hypothetical protein
MAFSKWIITYEKGNKNESTRAMNEEIIPRSLLL